MTAQQHSGTHADAIASVVPHHVLEPATLTEATEVMQLAAHKHWHVAPVGGATALELGFPPRILDAIIRTGRLDRLIDYAPADMVIDVEAGMTLAALQALVAPHGQRFGLDAPHPEQATLGGLVATGAIGPQQMRYGALRDLVLGLSFIRADGVRVRGGSHVVKNVAGFDLPKLLCGSLGTLGVIDTVTLRLHPRPETTALGCVRELPPEGVVMLVQAARAAQLEPSAVVALSSRSGHHERYTLGLQFEGFAAGVKQQLDTWKSLVHTHIADRTGPDIDIDHEMPHAFFTAQSAVRSNPAGDQATQWLRLRLAAPPSQLPALHTSITRLLGHLGDRGFVWYATLGIGFVSGSLHQPADILDRLLELRHTLVGQGGSLVVETMPAALRSVLDPWGPVPPGFALMQHIKQRFDPEGRLNPGRFIGRL